MSASTWYEYRNAPLWTETSRYYVNHDSSIFRFQEVRYFATIRTRSCTFLVNHIIWLVSSYMWARVLDWLESKNSKTKN